MIKIEASFTYTEMNNMIFIFFKIVPSIFNTLQQIFYWLNNFWNITFDIVVCFISFKGLHVLKFSLGFI